jgi:hypothetical protein
MGVPESNVLLIDALKCTPRTAIGTLFGKDTLRVVMEAEDLTPEIRVKVISEESDKLDGLGKIGE